jgi:hypothetical protein
LSDRDWLMVALFFAAQPVLSLSSCGRHDEIVVSVDGQAFAVPRDYLLPYDSLLSAWEQELTVPLEVSRA